MELGWCDVCLDVKDVVASRDFYAKLGFRVVEGKVEEGWQVMTNDDLRLGLYHGHMEQETLMLNFRGGDVFANAEALQAKGLAFEKGPLVERDKSAAAILRDPDGYAIFLNTAPGETKPV
jgi:catechol 2,3-dioxygenase-like lactoylglutathione lyase family enzyme